MRWLFAAIVLLPVIAAFALRFFVSRSQSNAVKAREARKTARRAGAATNRSKGWNRTDVLAWAIVITVLVIIACIVISCYSFLYSFAFGQNDFPAQSRVRCPVGSTTEMQFCSLNGAGTLFFRSEGVPADWRLCHDPKEEVGLQTWVNRENGHVSFRFYPLWKLAPDERVVVRYQFMPACPATLPEH